MKKENVLSAPANYDLATLFAELKFGRPAESQKYLDKCIEEIESPPPLTFLECLDDLKTGNVKDLNSFTEKDLERAAKNYAYDRLANFLTKTFKTEL
jgi:hypothetical protein